MSFRIFDSNDDLRYVIDYDDCNIISIYSKDLNLHFNNQIHSFDLYRYIYLTKKQLNDIGYGLINSDNDWNIINSCCDVLRMYRDNHYNYFYDDNGYLKKYWNDYFSIAFHLGFLKRSEKTIDRINQLIGIYSNYLLYR